jgi:Ca2+-binding RTX toxin-like protein
VIDNQGAHNSATASFVVDGTNDAPHITSGQGFFAEYSVAEHTRYVTTVTAQDPEGDALTFSLTPNTFDSHLFTIDAHTGVLAFKVAPNFEFPQDLFHNNAYVVSVLVNDGHGGIDAQLIEVEVTNLQNEVSDNNGNNSLHGIFNKTNYLSGNGGNDILVGANKNDVLVGGSGNDTMTGGGGHDTFVFNPNFGKDTITDFNVSHDVIEIDHTVFSGFADLMAHTADVGGHAVISVDPSNTNTITLNGVATAALTQADFHFV